MTNFYCMKGLINFSLYHNDQLKQPLEKLRKENPNVVIVYGDYYNTFQWVYCYSPLFLGSYDFIIFIDLK